MPVQIQEQQSGAQVQLIHVATGSGSPLLLKLTVLITAVMYLK
jgi:hypothetical protein